MILKKRLHLKLKIIEKETKKISATIEWLSLYVNLETRKVTEFENEKIEIMDDFINQNCVCLSKITKNN